MFLLRNGSGKSPSLRLIRLGSAPCSYSGSLGFRATRRTGTCCIDYAKGWSMRIEAICLGLAKADETIIGGQQSTSAGEA